MEENFYNIFLMTEPTMGKLSYTLRDNNMVFVFILELFARNSFGSSWKNTSLCLVILNIVIKFMSSVLASIIWVLNLLFLLNVDPEIIQFLLKLGLDVEAKDEDGRTPLHISTSTIISKNILSFSHFEKTS